MSILFKPNGQLDIQSAATDLPDDGLTRCRNMRVDRRGQLKTRPGSARINGQEDRYIPAPPLITTGTAFCIISHAWEVEFANAPQAQFTTADASVSGQAHVFSWEVDPWSGTDTWAYRAMFAHEQMGFTESGVWLIHNLDTARYVFSGGSLYYNNEQTALATGLSDARWSAISYNQFNDTTKQVYACNGADRKRIEGRTVAEWGIDKPVTVPVIVAGASTGLTGDYNVRYTYAKKKGTTVVSESNPSDAAAAAVTLSNQSLDITWTASPDSQVTHVRVYRTTAGGAVYQHVSDYAVGTTTDDDATADTALGASVATNHDRPPVGTVVRGPNFNGTCFMIKDNLLHYSLPKQPEHWPATYFIEVSSTHFPGQALVFWNGQPHVLTTTEIYAVQGTLHPNFVPVPMRARTGAQGSMGAFGVGGRGLYHTGPDGVYLFTGPGNDRKISKASLDPLFRGETVNGMPGVADMSTALIHHHDGVMWFFYTDHVNRYPQNAITIDLDTGDRLGYHRYNDGSYDVEFRTIMSDSINDRLLIGDNAGFVRQIDAGTEDSGNAIDWELQSKDFTLQTRAHFPRWNKYDVDASETTVTGTTLLDGEIIQTHSLTKDRDTRRRLIESDNGERLGIRLSGSGPATVYGVETE